MARSNGLLMISSETGLLRRRQFLGAGLALAAAAGCGEGAASAIFPPAPVQPDAPSFVQPEVRSSHSGMLDTDLRAQFGINQLGSQTVQTRTFGGNLVGPTLRVKPGQDQFAHPRPARLALGPVG